MKTSEKWVRYPVCNTISKRCCAIGGGVSCTGPLRIRVCLICIIWTYSNGACAIAGKHWTGCTCRGSDKRTQLYQSRKTAIKNCSVDQNCLRWGRSSSVDAEESPEIRSLNRDFGNRLSIFSQEKQQNTEFTKFSSVRTPESYSIRRRPKSIHQYCAKGSPTTTLKALWCICIFLLFPLKTSFLVYTNHLFCLLRHLSFQS